MKKTGGQWIISLKKNKASAPENDYKYKYIECINWIVICNKIIFFWLESFNATYYKLLSRLSMKMECDMIYILLL